MPKIILIKNILVVIIAIGIIGLGYMLSIIYGDKVISLTRVITIDRVIGIITSDSCKATGGEWGFVTNDPDNPTPLATKTKAERLVLVDKAKTERAQKMIDYEIRMKDPRNRIWLADDKYLSEGCDCKDQKYYYGSEEEGCIPHDERFLFPEIQ